MQGAEQSSVTFKGVVTHKITPKEPELDTWFIKTIEFFQQWHLFTRICNSLVQRQMYFREPLFILVPSFLPGQVTAAPNTITCDGFQIQYGVHCSHLVNTGRNQTGCPHVDHVHN